MNLEQETDVGQLRQAIPLLEQEHRKLIELDPHALSVNEVGANGYYPHAWI